MAFPTKDGTKSYGSKFRASRYDRENAPTDPGARSQANKLEGKNGQANESAPDAESRLHNNPHPEKFNTPLDGPKASADTQEPGEEQSESRDQHTVTCPECGAEVATDAASDAHSEPHDNGMSETEQDVQNDKVAKGVWKPGQREHPDAGGDTDSYDVEPL